VSITKNYVRLREEIPEDVTIVLSCKTRTREQIEETIDAGATDNKSSRSCHKNLVF